MAQAGPETQQRLLKALGVKQLLVTDGVTPLNLYNSSPQPLLGKQ